MRTRRQKPAPAAQGVQHEIKQGKPFSSTRQEALLGLLRTADLVHRRFEHVLAPHAVTIQQYNVLRILRGAGAAGLPTLEIASRMIEQTPGITRLLDRLEAKRLVRRERCRQDRRQVLCFISADGLRLLDVLDAPVLKADNDCLAALAEHEIASLIGLLDRVRAGHAAGAKAAAHGEPETEEEGERT